MELILELPDTLLMNYKDKHFLSKAFKLNNALILYKRGDISISRASELANIDIYDFIKECSNNDIPVINYTKEELLRDIDDTCSR